MTWSVSRKRVLVGVGVLAIPTLVVYGLVVCAWRARGRVHQIEWHGRAMMTFPRLERIYLSRAAELESSDPEQTLVFHRRADWARREAAHHARMFERFACAMPWTIPEDNHQPGDAVPPETLQTPRFTARPNIRESPMTAAVLLFTLSLASLERGEAAYRPSAAEVSVPEPFRLAAATFPYELEEIRRTHAYTVSALRFPSPVPTPERENNTVHAEYFRPHGAARHPAVIVLHILGADFALSRYMAARLADRGVAALFVKLPYYGERRPPGGQKRFLSTDIERSMTSQRQGVCDVRRAAAWLAGRPEVDPERLGVTGISLGGIVSAVAVAIDPKLTAGAFLLAGGGLADILWEMPEAARYRTLWIESGRTKADLEALTRPYDPLTYAARLKGKRLLMMAGNVDEVIPPSAARALWDAAGRPPIRWYDCGHYSAAGYLLPAVRETVEFFAGAP